MAEIIEIDVSLRSTLTGWASGQPMVSIPRDDIGVSDETLLKLFDAQCQSRHLDFTLRWLQGRGQGFYTIGSSGHESNAAVAMALRPTDPALLHYRSGAFFAARAAQRPETTPIDDVLHSAMASQGDPIAQGRHKVFGHPGLGVIPQTSTIASHLPRAVGMAFALGRTAAGYRLWPDDSVVVASMGDASINHSTTTGALNAAAYCLYRDLPLPLLIVCEDNGIGISTPTPKGWTAAALASWPGIPVSDIDGTESSELLTALPRIVARIRATRQPAIVHLRTVRLMGHAGSDIETAYRTRSSIVSDFDRDPLLATAALLVSRGALDAQTTLDRYDEVGTRIRERARDLVQNVKRLDGPAAIMSPLISTPQTWDNSAEKAIRASEDRDKRLGTLPEHRGQLTLAQSINAALHDIMLSMPQASIFGEDVAHKGGVYGVTRGLQRTFGPTRVFDTILDEQTILGLALGAGLAGGIAIPEIQYLAYLHNAEDQIRGEGASLPFFSSGQYSNPMVVRIAGLAYQKGFGGHFHNDNSVAVLRDIPGLAVAVASHPASAPALLRRCAAWAQREGRVSVFIEPIALYHERHLDTGDQGWLAPYQPPGRWVVEDRHARGVRRFRSGRDLELVSFGNGVRFSLRVADRLQREGIEAGVIDLQWVSPLPVSSLLNQLAPGMSILVVDETRRSGGVGEGVVTELVQAGHTGLIRRVSSVDSFVPLGPLAADVLLGEVEILDAARTIAQTR